MTVIIGCDPGITGAFAALRADKIGIADMPTRKADGHESRKAKNEIDNRELGRTFTTLMAGVDPAQCVLVIEEITTRPVSSSFAKGGSFGSVHSEVALKAAQQAVISVAEVLGITVTRVQPKKWQKFYGIRRNQVSRDQKNNTTKDQSLDCARRLFPQLQETLQRKKDAGRADALLIAWHHLRHNPQLRTAAKEQPANV